MPSKKPSMLCRTTKEIKEKTEKIAELESRSVSEQIEYILKRYIEEYESQNGIVNTKTNQTINNNGFVGIQNNINK